MVGTLVVLVWWIALGLSFVGIGWWAGARNASAYQLPLAFWLGVSVTVATLHIGHLFFPIDERSTVAVLGIGLVGVWRARLTIPWRTLSSAGAVVAAIGVAWLANRSTGPTDQYDSLIYHLHAVEWMRSFPVVPGLGNLHDRLALNNSSFLLAALIEPGPLEGQSAHLLNGLFHAALWVQAAGSFDRLLARHTLQMSGAVPLVLLFPLLSDASHYRVSSLGTDLPAYLFLFVAVWAAMVEREIRERTWLIATVVFAITAVCMKITALPMAGLISLVMLSRALQWPDWRALWGGVIGCAAIWLLPWMLHGVMLSGYAMYPLAGSRVNVTWAVPAEVASATKKYAEDFARTADFRREFDPRPLREPWVRAWATRQLNFFKADTVVPAVLIAAMLGLGLLRGGTLGLPLDMMLALTGAVLFWFVNAPLERFGLGILWSTAAFLGAGALTRLRAAWQQTTVAVGWLLFGVTTLLVPLILNGGTVANLKAPTQGLFIPSSPTGWFHQPESGRVATMSLFRTATGLDLSVPVQGPGGWRSVRLGDRILVGQPLVKASCWPGPLLRTPYPNPALKLRDSSSLAYGFELEKSISSSELEQAMRDGLTLTTDDAGSSSGP